MLLELVGNFLAKYIFPYNAKLPKPKLFKGTD